jgi:molecular chaperone HscA
LQGRDLNGVILVGGSTRMPSVRALVGSIFGQEPLCDAHPDEAVALGAALQADLLTGGAQDLLLLDVTPLSLGLETMGGVVEKLIPRNAAIPVRASATFTTFADGQNGMDMHVVQGEREKVSDCKSLARFRLTGIPPMAAGMGRVEVVFALDADGLLTVSAKETTTGTTALVAVKPSYGLSDEEVGHMLLESMEHAELDMEERLLIEARVEAVRMVEATQTALKKDGGMLEPADRRCIEDAVAAVAEAVRSKDRQRITALVDGLDKVTAEFARRRMTEGIARALKHRSVQEFA